MATRGPDGRLVDAWGQPGCRHGTLSNPAYREYLLSWCRKQIDAGADYLFMDEINAAPAEPARASTTTRSPIFAPIRCAAIVPNKAGRGAIPAGKRRSRSLSDDPPVCPDGRIGSFQYRGYLASRGLSGDPHQAENPLAALRRQFRADRDDRAWKWLTDAIRAYAASRGRRVLSAATAGPLRRLQVLGVWDKWRTAGGAVDLTHSQLDDWGATVANGWSMAGRRCPSCCSTIGASADSPGWRSRPTIANCGSGPRRRDLCRGRVLRVSHPRAAERRRAPRRHARRSRPANHLLPATPKPLPRRPGVGLRAAADAGTAVERGGVAASVAAGADAARDQSAGRAGPADATPRRGHGDSGRRPAEFRGRGLARLAGRETRARLRSTGGKCAWCCRSWRPTRWRS